MAVCPLTGKTRYENRGRARAAYRHMSRQRKRQGLNWFHCSGPGSCGGWHLGRLLTRATKAWSG
jgi:hypothetical protein